MEPQVRPSPQGSPQFVSKSEVIDCEDQMTNKMEQLASQFPQRSGYPIFLPPVKVSGIGAEFLSPPTVTPAAASMLPTQLPLQHQLYSLAMQQQQQQLRHPQHLLAAAAVASGSQIFPWPLHFGYNKAYPLDPRFFVAIGGANGGAGVVCRPPDEPKPQHSYIGLIAMAILSSTENKLVLSDIYRYILDNYSYFRNRGSGWRNSIRHNLSLNDCFIKAGRSPNGKGHFWAIHPANIDDFRKGDFRRRKAQRRVRKHMGLSVEEEDDDSLSSPPSPVAKLHLSASSNCLIETMCSNNEDDRNRLTETDVACSFSFRSNSPGTESYRRDNGGHRSAEMNEPKTYQKRRQFDVASLLAPDLDVQSSTLRGKTDEVTSSQSQCSESHTVAQHSSLNLQAPPPTGCQSHKEALRCDAFKLKTSPLKITTTSLSDVVLDNSSKKLHNKKTETERLEDDCFQRKQQEFTAVERDERDEQKSPEDLCSSPPDLAARGNPRRSSLDWATLQALQSIRHRIRSVTSSFSN